MSSTLYDSLLAKWREHLEQYFSAWSSSMSDEDSDDLYDELVREFCKKRRYSEKTRDLAFYGRWYDTFKDEYYQKLEKEGIKIIHEVVSVRGA